jgi:hypothetical protein
MAKRIARVYLARMVGAFKDVLPLGRGIVYRRDRENHREIVGSLERTLPRRFPRLRQPSDPGGASGWTRFAIIGKLPHAENLHLEEVQRRVIANRGWAI